MNENKNIEEKKDYMILQKDIENTCGKLLENSFHEFEDLNYKAEHQRNNNCRKALFNYYDKNHIAFGHECIDKLIEYIRDDSRGTWEYGYNTSRSQIENWLKEIEDNYAALKQEYDASVQQSNENTTKTERIPEPEQAKPQASESKKVLLKIPSGLNREERKELEDALFKAGARYTKETIPADKSNTGKEVYYKSWYVMQKENTDMTPFQEYIRPGKNVEKQTDLPEKKSQSMLSEQQTSKEKDSEDKIYLNLPHVSKAAFSKLIEEISKNGAKFDGKAKAWYITENADFNQFKKYLGLSKEQVDKKRESVIDKLNKNKDVVNSQPNAENNIQREARQNDAISK